jgi:hypothetical protein
MHCEDLLCRDLLSEVVTSILVSLLLFFVAALARA